MFAFLYYGLFIFSPLKIGDSIFFVGILLFLIGLLGLIIALFNFKDGSVNKLATTGLYKITRNPQWICLILLHLGICISIGSFGAIFLLIIAVFLSHIRVLAEEKACGHEFGDDYKIYLKTVPRYFF